MLQPFRLEYFGTFALILPICRLIDDLRERARRVRVAPGSLGAGGVAVVPPLPGLPGPQAGLPPRDPPSLPRYAGDLPAAEGRLPPGPGRGPRRAQQRALHPLSFRMLGHRQQFHPPAAACRR